jgi:hypothetical protein
MELAYVGINETRDKLKPIINLMNEFNEINKELIKCEEQHNELAMKLNKKEE